MDGCVHWFSVFFAPINREMNLVNFYRENASSQVPQNSDSFFFMKTKIMYYEKYQLSVNVLFIHPFIHLFLLIMIFSCLFFRLNQCHRCLALSSPHKNVLRYKESESSLLNRVAIFTDISNAFVITRRLHTGRGAADAISRLLMRANSRRRPALRHVPLYVKRCVKFPNSQNCFYSAKMGQQNCKFLLKMSSSFSKIEYWLIFCFDSKHSGRSVPLQWPFWVHVHAEHARMPKSRVRGGVLRQGNGNDVPV